MKIQTTSGSFGFLLLLPHHFRPKKYPCSISAKIMRFVQNISSKYSILFQEFFKKKFSSKNVKPQKKCSLCNSKFCVRSVTYDVHKSCFKMLGKVVPIAEGDIIFYDKIMWYDTKWRIILYDMIWYSVWYKGIWYLGLCYQCRTSSKPVQEALVVPLDDTISPEKTNSITADDCKRRNAAVLAEMKLDSTLKRSKSDTSESLIG